MNQVDIISKMNEYALIKAKHVVEKKVNISNISFTNVRDKIIGIGKILEENLVDTYYIVNIPAGFANKNYAIVFIKYNKNNLELWSYAKEGLINQHTAVEAIEKILKKILSQDKHSEQV